MGLMLRLRLRLGLLVQINSRKPLPFVRAGGRLGLPLGLPLGLKLRLPLRVRLCHHCTVSNMH